jgi:nitrogen fixation protein FixH
MSEQAPVPKRRFEPWAWGPLLFFVILIAGHLVLVAQMTRADASTVESNAYERSNHYDADQAAITRFEDLGLRLECLPAGPGAVTCSIVGGDAAQLQAARLEFYRPDAAALDQTIAWDDPSRSLDLALPRSGAWRVTLVGEVQGEMVRTAVSLRL